MGKQGHGKVGQSKGKPKKEDRGFGRALIRQQQNGLAGDTLGVKKKNMNSILEASDLADYVDNLEMEDRTVDVHRVRSDADAAFIFQDTTASTAIQSMKIDAFQYEHLPVPRKPRWSRSMTAEEVDKNERVAFLDWRRRIATLEESNNRTQKATPFEKNLEVWRQLWRVLEKSDVAIQVVDARNPLLYYTADLVKYAQEHSPSVPMMIILNKADYLTEYQRTLWSQTLDALDIKYIFYSAKSEQRRIDHHASLHTTTSVLKEEDQMLEAERAEAAMNRIDNEMVDLIASDLATRFIDDLSDDDESDGEKESDELSSELKSFEKATEKKEKKGLDRLQAIETRMLRRYIMSRAELISLLSLLPRKMNIGAQERHGDRVCIGMVGFPNVGKSSCINSILGVSKSTHGKTRVAVSSTPGKTKHFQTMMVNDGLMLCDCPGLVFPSFMRSTGEMLCAGILPINQMRTYADPADVISARVPMQLIEATYGCTIQKMLDIKDDPERPPTGSEMLCAYCAVKGYITNGTGRWDEFRACKEILKDFCDGNLLYIAPPPEIEVDMNRWLRETERTMLQNDRVAERMALRALKEDGNKTSSSGQSSSGNKYKVFGDVVMGENMVFGDGAYEKGDNGSDEVEGEEVKEEEEEEGTLTPPELKDAPITVSAAEASHIVFDDESSDEEEDVETAILNKYTAEIVANKGRGAPKITALGEVEVGVNGKPKREHKKMKHWGKKNKKLRDKDPYGEAGAGSMMYTTNRAPAYSSYVNSKSKADTRNAASKGTINKNSAEFHRAVFPHHDKKDEA